MLTPLTPIVCVEQGAFDPYLDPELYDHEYRRRRHDVAWYRQLAQDSAQIHPEPILELGSGTGRLLLPLARDGHRVIGIERSAAMLARCNQRIRPHGQKVASRIALVQGDFRDLPLATTEKLALILCPFNGFSHLYDRLDLERFLSGIRGVLRRDGLFAFDVVHPDPAWLSKDSRRRWSRTRFRHPRTREPLIYSTNHDYLPAEQILLMRLYYEPDFSVPFSDRSAPATVVLTHRLYFPDELVALLHYNGFSVWHRAGGFDGQALSPSSREQVLCVRLR